jgi:hypothetical protein
VVRSAHTTDPYLLGECLYTLLDLSFSTSYFVNAALDLYTFTSELYEQRYFATWSTLRLERGPRKISF